jgi:hypothetical protein
MRNDTGGVAMASEVNIEELQQDLRFERYRGDRLQAENSKLNSEIDRLQLRMMMLRRVGIIPMDDVAVENGELQSAAITAGRIVRRELDRALWEHELFEDPAHALLALRGELDEVACAISVHDLTGPHGYLSEVAQVAAVAIKSVISYLWYREEQK